MNITNYSVYHQNYKGNNLNKGYEKTSKVETDVKFLGKQKNLCKKVSPYILSGLMLLGIKSCPSGENVTRCSGEENFNNIKVEYFDVKQDTKDSIMVPIKKLKSKLTSENDFLDGLNIDITKKFSSLNDSNSFRIYAKNRTQGATKGLSFYSDKKLPRRIIIQEKVHALDKFRNYKVTGEYTAVPALRQSLMHEVGHQFDNYFGHDHNSYYAQKWDSIMYAQELDKNSSPYKFETKTTKDKDIDIKYNKNSSLSDKKIFKEAILKDIKNIQALKNANSKDLPKNLSYYIQNLNLSKEITIKDIEKADLTCAEVYANLFSYAIGEDEGDRKQFIKCFRNSYGIVKNNISKYLNIAVK